MTLLTLYVPIDVEADEMSDGRTLLHRCFKQLSYTSISEGEHDLEEQARLLGRLIEAAIDYENLMAKLAAQGTEAQRAETVEQGSVHDGPVREANAPNSSRTTP